MKVGAWMYYHMKVKLVAMTVIEMEKDCNELGAKCFSDRETVLVDGVGRDWYILRKYGTDERQGNEINEALTVKEELFYLLFF